MLFGNSGKIMSINIESKEMKFEYFNQCDRWRIKYPNGESGWQEMMANKTPMNIGNFKKMVDFDGLLDSDDENDTIENYIMGDPDSGFYHSEIQGTKVLFFQTAGFEFIFTEDGEEPKPTLDKNNDSGMAP